MGPAVNRTRLSPEYLKNLYTASSDRPDPPSEPRESGVNKYLGRERISISEEAHQMKRAEKAKNIYSSSIDQQKEINKPGPDQRKINEQEKLESRPEGKVKEQKEIFEKYRVEREEANDLERTAERERKEDTQATRNSKENRPEIPVPETTERATRSTRDDTLPTAGVSNANNSEIIQAYASAANFTQASITVNYKL